MAVGASAGTVKDELNLIPCLSGAGETVSVSKSGSTYRVTFNSNRGNSNVITRVFHKHIYICRFLLYLHQAITVEINGYVRITFHGYMLYWTS